MKDKLFDNITIPVDEISPEILKVIFFAADEEYDEALDRLDDYIVQVEDDEQKNIAVMMFLQILVLAGFGETASVMLKALLKNLKFCSKEKSLCKRTIKNIYNE